MTVTRKRSTIKTASGGEHATNGRKIRYAVVGLGYISQAAILPAFAHARENSELAALVSGDPKKRAALSKKYKVDQTYGYEQFGECLMRGGIDAVYIGLPNHMHRAYSEAAARAGVHVLCEKPMAVHPEDCEAMIEAARESNVKLMIAYRLHFERGNLSAIATLREGEIGEPRIFRSAFTQQVPAGNIRLTIEDGGGPLYDLGVYCVNAARYLFRAEPDEVFCYNAAGTDRRFDGVAEMSSAVMRFPNDRLAVFTCSFGATDRDNYEVIGTKGVLKMDPGYAMSQDIKCEIIVGEKTRKTTYKRRDQFGPELVYFSDCILNNKQPEPGGVEGLTDVRIIAALQESAANGRPVTISTDEPKVTKRPTLQQEIQKRAVEEPPLVRAAAPSR
ncbi:MAG: Gfo/Idh/MocA family oxidoreductase [Candidatus Acidiferrales bacterium]